MSNRLRNILPEKIEDMRQIKYPETNNLEVGKTYALHRGKNPRSFIGIFKGYSNKLKSQKVFDFLFQKENNSKIWRSGPNDDNSKIYTIITDDDRASIYDLPDEFKENDPNTIFQRNKQENTIINRGNADFVFENKTGKGGDGPSRIIASYLGGKKRKTLKKRKLRKGGSGRKSSIIKSRNYPLYTRTDISISDEQKQLDDIIKKGYISNEHANKNRECLDNKKRKNDEEIDELIKSVFSEEEDYKKKPVKRSKKHINSLLKLGGHHKCKKSKKRCRH